MVQGNATLVVDLGNSSTKGRVLFGKDTKTGNYRVRSFELSNVFAKIAPNYEVASDYSDQLSTILRVDTEVGGLEVKGDFCNGELQQRESPKSIIKPSAVDKKWNLDSSVLSLRLAFLHAYKEIMKICRVSDFRQIDVSWNVVTLLPPGDMDTGREPITEMIRNITHIESVFPEASIDIRINNVMVFPEGFCAYAGVVFDSGSVFRAETKFLTEESVLVLDIGAGTTDICVIRNGRLVQSSKYTIQTGGNNVYQQVRRQLMKQGLWIDETDVQRGVVTGTVRDGAKQVNIINDVNQAKESVAQTLVAEVQDFLELTETRIRSIGYILVCGGGAMSESDVPEIMPLSTQVFESIKKLSPNCGLVQIPTHVVSKTMPDGDTVRAEEQISPRELNIIGASILAESKL